MPFFLGVRRISQLAIDGDKDFSGRALLNVRLSDPVLSGTVSGAPAWASAQSFPSPLAVGNLVLATTGLTLPRTFTFPDLADTVVTLSAPQTLSNKTLSAPALSGTVTGAYTLGGSPTLASDLALSGARTIGGTLTVDPVGRNVGIGTTAPLAKLEVFGGDISLRGATSTVCSILFKSTYGNATVGSIDAALSFWGLDYLRFRPLRTWGGGNYGSHFMGVVDSPAGYPTSNQHLSINTDTLKREAVLYVDSTGGRHAAVFMNGNVGIGTTAPEFRLDVAGDVGVRGNILPDADNQGNIGLDTRRWARIRSVLVVAGDYVFENGWRLTEWGDGIALLRPDGSVAAVWN